MEVLTLAALAALVVKVMTVVKSIGKNNNAVVTQVLTWLVGIGAAVLASHSMVTADLVVFGVHRLADLDTGSLILAGMSISSAGSFGYDAIKGVDNTNSATEPKLTKLPTA